MAAIAAPAPRQDPTDEPTLFRQIEGFIRSHAPHFPKTDIAETARHVAGDSKVRELISELFSSFTFSTHPLLVSMEKLNKTTKATLRLKTDAAFRLTAQIDTGSELSSDKFTIQGTRSQFPKNQETDEIHGTLQFQSSESFGSSRSAVVYLTKKTVAITFRDENYSEVGLFQFAYSGDDEAKFIGFGIGKFLTGAHYDDDGEERSTPAFVGVAA